MRTCAPGCTAHNKRVSVSDICAVIPARLASTRLPRKPLTDLSGRPMVVWTWEAAARSGLFGRVLVATDSPEVASVVEQAGGEAVLTPDSLQTGTDRAAFVARDLPQYSVFVNLQGDEPLVTKAHLGALVSPYLRGERPPMATLAFPLGTAALGDPATVKVVCDQRGNAMYFSRGPIPWLRTGGLQGLPAYHHMGLYAFTREFLLEFSALAQTPLEIVESLEQLRALENGIPIHVSLAQERSWEVNTPEELEEARRVLRKRLDPKEGPL